MFRSIFAFAAILLAVTAAAARVPSRDDTVTTARAQAKLEHIARLCRRTAYHTIQGRGRDKYISLYFSECLRRGGPF